MKESAAVLIFHVRNANTLNARGDRGSLVQHNRSLLKQLSLSLDAYLHPPLVLLSHSLQSIQSPPSMTYRPLPSVGDLMYRSNAPLLGGQQLPALSQGMLALRCLFPLYPACLPYFSSWVPITRISRIQPPALPPGISRSRFREK